MQAELVILGFISFCLSMIVDLLAVDAHVEVPHSMLIPFEVQTRRHYMYCLAACCLLPAARCPAALLSYYCLRIRLRKSLLRSCFRSFIAPSLPILPLHPTTLPLFS